MINISDYIKALKYHGFVESLKTLIAMRGILFQKSISHHCLVMDKVIQAYL